MNLEYLLLFFILVLFFITIIKLFNIELFNNMSSINSKIYEINQKLEEDNILSKFKLNSLDL